MSHHNLTQYRPKPFPNADGYIDNRGKVRRGIDPSQIFSWLNGWAHRLKNAAIAAGEPLDVDHLADLLVIRAQKESPSGWFLDPYDGGPTSGDMSVEGLRKRCVLAVEWAIEQHDEELRRSLRRTASRAGKSFQKLTWGRVQATRKMGATAAAHALGVSRDAIYKARKRWQVVQTAALTAHSDNWTELAAPAATEHFNVERPQVYAGMMADLLDDMPPPRIGADSKGSPLLGIT